MKTILLTLCLFLGANSFAEVESSSRSYLKHSTTLLKDGTAETAPLKQAMTAAEMKAKAELERMRILANLRISAEIMDAGPIEKIVEEIRKQFCDETQREKFAKEFVEPIKKDYDELKDHETQWQQKIVAITDKINGGPRGPGVNPGRQKDFFKSTDKLRGQKPPKVHQDPAEAPLQPPPTP